MSDGAVIDGPLDYGTEITKTAADLAQGLSRDALKFTGNVAKNTLRLTYEAGRKVGKALHLKPRYLVLLGGAAGLTVLAGKTAATTLGVGAASVVLPGAAVPVAMGVAMAAPVAVAAGVMIKKMGIRAGNVTQNGSLSTTSGKNHKASLRATQTTRTQRPMPDAKLRKAPSVFKQITSFLNDPDVKKIRSERRKSLLPSLSRKYYAHRAARARLRKEKALQRGVSPQTQRNHEVPLWMDNPKAAAFAEREGKFQTKADAKRSKTMPHLVRAQRAQQALSTRFPTAVDRAPIRLYLGLGLKRDDR